MTTGTLEFPLEKKAQINPHFLSRLNCVILSFVDELHSSNWLTSRHLMGTI